MADGGTTVEWKPTLRDRMVARAAYIVSVAIKRGLLPEIEACACMDCGAPAECYDHRNYHHPLAVDPVCKGCNNRRGPGFPPLEAADGGAYKHGVGRRAGHRWNGIESDASGYVLEPARVFAEINWGDLDDREDYAGERAANFSALKMRQKYERWANTLVYNGTKTTKHFQRGQTYVSGTRGLARDDYFKAHDPWSLT